MVAAMTPAASKLACDIVRDQLGELAERVGRSLIYDGRQTLPEILKTTGLTPQHVKDALLSLMQQNCVASWQEQPQEGARGPPQQVYEATPDRILQRLRHPRFLLHARDTLGTDAEALLEGLLEHGRLQLSQLLQRAATKAGQPTAVVQPALEAAFVALVDSRFVERVPSGCIARPYELQSVPHIATATRGRGAARGGAAAAAYEAATVEIAAQRAREEADRFRLPAGLLSRVNTRELENPTDGGARKRKRDEESIDAASGAQPDGERILWRANYEEFNRRFRHEMCAALVRQKVDTDAGDVIAAMLQLSRPHETRLQEDRSAPLAEVAITAVVSKAATRGACRIQPENVPEVLRRLAADTSELVTCVGEAHGGASYCVNMKRIIDLIRMKEVDAVVRERFGGPACRIFRLLLLKRQLEQKQIAEMAMIPVKDTRELLYKLVKVEFVQLQEVARTADHSPSRTFYLWRVDLLRVIDRLCTELYRTVSKVRARLLHEVQKEQEVMARLEAVAAGHAADGHTISLTAEQRSRLQRVRQVAAALEVSCMRLDQLALLFHDV